MSEESKVLVPEPLVKVENLCKFFQISRNQVLKAVNNVSFEIHKGETVGLVGESGCGKSTTGRCLVRLYEPTSGHVYYRGKDISTLSRAELKTFRGDVQMSFQSNVQMIFQNPYASLNPRMTVGEIVSEGIKLHHSEYTKQQVDERVEQLLKWVGLGKEHISRFSHEFSGGQRQRIGIARALSVEPEFVVCDEPISALDVSIQAQVINMLKRLQQELGLTYLFIAHDLSVVKYISDRVIVMYLGTVVEEAPADEIYAPPTQALLSSIPIADPDLTRSRKRITIKGEIPSPINPKECCQFADRCPYATEQCHNQVPVRKEIAPDHFVSCHLV